MRTTPFKVREVSTDSVDTLRKVREYWAGVAEPYEEKVRAAKVELEKATDLYAALSEIDLNRFNKKSMKAKLSKASSKKNLWIKRLRIALEDVHSVRHKLAKAEMSIQAITGEEFNKGDNAKE